mgnify:CR=1 FL=1
MYPIARLIKEFVKYRNAPDLDILEEHVSRHMCLPWDLDFMMELNNGRTLTLYDLGRLVLAKRAGLLKAIRSNRWGLTMAGANVRYRRRIRMFERFEMRSRVTCWDARFVYLEQSMWQGNGECAGHIVYRVAVTDTAGIVDTGRLSVALGVTIESPPIPDWIAKWIAAEDARPWPPMQENPA